MLAVELLDIPELLREDGRVLTVHGVEVAVGNSDRIGCQLLAFAVHQRPTLASLLYNAAVRSRTPGIGVGYITIAQNGLVFVPAPHPGIPFGMQNVEKRPPFHDMRVLQEAWRG